MIKLKKYKDIQLYYKEEDGQIYFTFEGSERRTSYVFEAERIIDEPRWEQCDMKGYFSDGYIDKFIGLAIAKRRDIKTGEPDWLVKSQYDRDFRRRSSTDGFYIYPENEKNDAVYLAWKDQKVVYQRELGVLNSIAGKLSDPAQTI